MPVGWSVIATLPGIRNNWKLILSNHNRSFPSLQLTSTQSLLGVILQLAPALSLAILRVPIQDSSHFLVIPAGIGMVLGVIVIDSLTIYISRIRLIAVGLLVAAAALVLLGLSDHLHGPDGTPMIPS